MDQPKIPSDPSKDTQFFLGELNGKVGHLQEQVAKFDERIGNKEETDRIRYETQQKAQSDHARRIFEKIDEIKGMAHETPCSAVEAAQADLDSLEIQVGDIGDDVRDIKTTGSTSWKAIIVACAVLVFILGTVIPLVILVWPKK